MKSPEPLQVTKVQHGRAVLDANGAAQVLLPESIVKGELNYQVGILRF